MSRFAIKQALLLTLSLLFCAPLLAFDPPVNTAGPLTIRIDGPQTLSDMGSPIAIRVKLESSADAPLSGKLRTAAIDGWQVQPNEPIAFSLAGKGSQTLEAKIIPDKHAYSALYPVHAFATFEHQGQSYTAHAILVISVNNPNPPRPAPPPYAWKPFELRNGVALRRLPARHVIVNVFGHEPRVMPDAWQGTDADSLAVCDFNSRANRGGRVLEAIAMHPPYNHNQPGTVAVQYPVHLPADAPIRLRFATAIRDNDAAHGEPPSDGVTFRVRVMPFGSVAKPAGGDLLHEHHSASKTWEEANVDLGRYAGQDVIVQLESDPGPKRDTTCDFSFWGEPILTTGPDAAGETAAKPVFPPAEPVEPIGRVGAPKQAWDIRVWPGRRGLLDATFGFDGGQRRLFYRGLHVRVNGDDLADPYSVNQLIGFSSQGPAGLREYSHTFRTPAGDEFDLLLAVSAQGPGLQINVTLKRTPPPQPWRVTYIEDVSIGPWSEKATQIYAGQGNVIRDPQAFDLGFDGHRLSTSFVGFDFANGVSLVQAVDVVPGRLEVDPGSQRYALHSPHPQTLTFIPAANVWAGAHAWHDLNHLKPAGGVEKLAGRFVFDCWGGKYADAATQLEHSFHYGLTNSLLVWHNWQRYGYDNRLPDIWPPNPAMGTLDEFKALANVCRKHGVLFAPHDNYIDFYPDAEGFSYQHIAFTQNREPIKAWFNPGPQAQSYRWRPDRVRPVVERNLKMIRDGIAPTAYFIDVWSSIEPYDYWTSDGQFHDRLGTTRTWGELFAWIRECLGENAPQISESGHDALVGFLDGAQTNHLRVGQTVPDGRDKWCLWDIGCGDAERIPWFDAAHHDRFVLHGAGYESRYLAGLDPRAHGMYSDDYIATEVLTAHPAMADRPFGRDVVRKYWLLNELMRRLALAQIESLSFDGDNIHRQHVRWRCRDGMADVWVNRGRDDWQIAGHTLPAYGWYARVGAKLDWFEAAVEQLNGRTVEWAGQPARLWCYVNPRFATGSAPAPQPAASPKLATFGPISTDGAFRIEVDNDNAALFITPLPGEPGRSLRLDLTDPAFIRRAWKTVEVLSETGEVIRKLPFTRAGDVLTLPTEAGVFAYRLSP